MRNALTTPARAAGKPRDLRRSAQRTESFESEAANAERTARGRNDGRAREDAEAAAKRRHLRITLARAINQRARRRCAVIAACAGDTPAAAAWGQNAKRAAKLRLTARVTPPRTQAISLSQRRGGKAHDAA